MLLFLLKNVTKANKIRIKRHSKRVSDIFCDVFVNGSGIAQWLERRTRDWRVTGSNTCRSGGRIFIFFSRVNLLCWLLFWYMFHPRVTTVAGKRSRSFCQKCRWHVTAKHTCTLRMWFCMKWHGCMVYTERAETAAVSCGTSHASAVSTPLWRSCDDSFHWWMIFLNSFSAILSLQWPRHTINCYCVPMF